MSETCIIIGASHAAAQLAPTLRQQGWEGRILVIGDEEYLPYQHPPLSKAYLSGEMEAEKLLIRPETAYEKFNIEFQLGVRVEHINRADKTLTLNNGETLSYDKLALCTGSRVRKINVPGSTLSGIHYLRDRADVNAIQTEVAADKKVVIVGGGYIGLETAASLNKLGLHITVLERAERVLERVTAPELSTFYARVHREEGVTIKTGVTVSAFNGDDNNRVNRVMCEDGSEFEADLVIVGIGVIPNTELAEAAGLKINNGIVVNQFAQTTDPDIVAAGDVTSYHNRFYDTHLRLESVPNASEQAQSAAASICGKERAYNALPWFWSDQYDLKLQIAGLNQGYDSVVIRGDYKTGRSFAAFYFKQGKLICADCVNRPQEFMISKRLITTKKAVDPALLVDESVAPKAFLN